MDLQCACTENPFILTANNFVVGQVYYFVLDGCSGNVCDYAIDVLAGSTVGVPPDNPGPITGLNEVCQGTSAAYSVSPVNAATIYNWTITPPGMGTVTGSGPNISVNWANNASGTAQLCLTVANLCYSNPMQSCYTVNVIPRPTATITGSGMLCFGSGATINLSVAFTGQGPWQFVYKINGVAQPPIQTSDNPYILTVNQPGTYTLQSVSTVTGNCAGTVSGSSVVTETKLTPTAVITNANCGLSNGAVNLSVSGGTTPYSYSWSSGQTTEDLSNVPAGTYTVVITDQHGCTETFTAVVGDNMIAINITGAVTSNTTCINGNGSIDITVTPSGTYTYQWSNNETTPDLTNVPPGTYTVTVTSGLTCTNTAEFTVDDHPNEPVITPNVTGTTCDLSNGAINLTVSGGVPPFTYQWDGGASSNSLTNIPAGTYTVTVTGANGCSSSAEITVDNTNPPFTINSTVISNTTCIGGNGSIDISVSPPGTYIYTWSTNVNTQDLNNLPPGTYTVTVSAGGSCIETEEFTVDDEPNEPSVNPQVTGTTCDLSNGSINLSVTGGLPPYTYYWDGGAVTSSLSNIPAGTYSVTVTGANGCTTTAEVTVTNDNPPITINANIVSNTTCIGGNGSIDVSISPPGSYTYMWSTNTSNQDLNNLPPGTYTLTVSAGGSCTEIAEFTVDDDPNAPSVNAIPTESTCDLNNGSITVSVSGGVPPFTYYWEGGQVTSGLNNIPAGSYAVTVTGANGCTGTAEATVSNNNPPIDITADVIASTTCIGGNGSINVSVSPPGNYTYLWSTMATTQDLGGLAPGTYTITVSMGGSCTAEAAFEVPEEPNVPELFFTAYPATCGLSNGSIDLTVFFGVPPYTYQWSNNQTTQDINNLPEDLYLVTVTGANGCSAVDGVALPNETIPITIGGDVSPQTSCVTNNGSIMLYLDPPSNLSILWSNSAVTPNLNNLAPGTYTVTVSAGGTCTETASFTVDDESEPPFLGVDVTPATCGFQNGAIDLEVYSGLQPYTYHWSNNAKTQDLGNLAAGNYAVTVTTSVGCTSVIFADVPNEDVAIEIYGVVGDNYSCTTPNGYIDIDVLPPGNNFQYTWSNGLHTEDLNNLSPGSYTVTVTLGTSCSAEITFDVYDVAAAPNVSVVGTPATCSLANGAANATVGGASPPYTFLWSNSAKTEDLTNLAPGAYTVTVNDFFGCSATASVVIVNNNIALNIAGVPAPNTACVAPNGAVNITVTPPGTYQYAWSNSQSTGNAVNLPAGTYTVTVSAGTTCSASATFIVADSTAIPVITPNITAAICGQSNGAIDIAITGATAPFGFLWSNMAVTEDLINILPGNYSVTVTDASGCMADTTLNVPNNSSTFALSGVASPLTNCVANNGAIDLTVTPAGPYTYAWSNLANTEDIANLPAGVYTVSVTETGNCIATATYIVNDGRTYPATTQVISPELCDLMNGLVDLSISGGESPYSYLWSGGQTDQDLLNIAAGVYTVIVTGSNGCTTQATANVPGNSVTFSLSGTPTPNASCIQSNGTVDLSVSPATSGTGLGYYFQWSNLANTEDVNNLSPGNYTVTVSAGGTCTATAVFTVNNIALPPTVGENITAAFCGQNSGAINLAITGGLAPFAFQWSNNAITEDLTGLPPGNYSVTVTGTNGCSTTESYVVPENTVIPVISGTSIANTLCIGNNGSINISVSPVLAYTYAWSSGQNVQNLSGLAPGTYTVVVNGGGACTNTASFVIDDDAEPPAISGTPMEAFCGQKSGSIDLTVSGGQAPYSYKWSTGAATEDLNSVVSGIYTVTVTGANGCTVASTFTIPEAVVIPAVTGIVAPNTSCVSPNGSIQLNVAPVLAYQYQWSGGQTTASLTNIAPGNYTVTVNGGGGCTATATFTVLNNIAAVSLSGQVTDILCFGDKTGRIDLSVNGGTQPFGFVWSPIIAGNPEDPDNLIAGSYTVTVTDASGCSASALFSIKQPLAALDLVCKQTSNVSAPGATDGGGTVNISGGTAPYQVVWSPGGVQANVPAGNFALNNLAVGNYAVTVTDANGCSAQCDFTIALITCKTALGTMSGNLQSLCGPGCLSGTYNPAGQFLEPGDVMQFVLHTGVGNQIVNEIARSNQPTFCFDPTLMSYGTTYFISAVAGNDDGAGNVDLSHFCTVITSGAPIVFQEKPVAGIDPPAKLSCAVKQVDLIGHSSIPGSGFSWSTSDGALLGNPAQPMIAAGAAGNYSLQVSANGCLDTAMTQVLDITNHPHALITANPSDILDCTISEIVLAGTAEGTLTANTIWISNGVIYPGGTILPVTTPGLYEFVILDTVTFCTDTARIQIGANQAYPPLFLNPPGLITCAHPTVTLTGGSPLPGIVLNWATVSGPDTTVIGSGATIGVSAPGTYYLLGSDPLNHCSNTLSTVVNADLTLPQADAGAPFSLACFGETGFLDGSASSGAPILNYHWSTADGHLVAGANSAMPEVNEPGTYLLLVTNPANGCTDTDAVIIDPKEPEAHVFVHQPPCFGGKGFIRIDSVSGGKPPIRYSLDDGQHFSAQNLFTNLSPGDYTLLVSDANGCTTVAGITIEEGDLFTVTLDPKVVLKLGESYQINTQINVPLTDLGKVNWQPPAGLDCDTCLNPLATPLSTTLYRITASNKAGCEDSAPILLVVDRRVDVYVPNIFSPDGDGQNDVLTIYADPKGVTKIKSFQVFSRWGERVYEYYNFEPNNPAYGWNGKFNGQDMNPAVFAWYAVVQFIDGTEKLYEGDVTLKR